MDPPLSPTFVYCIVLKLTPLALIVYREWIGRISFLRDPNFFDMIGMFLPVSLAMSIMSVACITCGGHGLIAGTMFYYANVSPRCL
jgi:hypothetical protein